MQLNPARLAAARALMAAETGAHADKALAAAMPEGAAPQDMGLARAIAFGVLRRRGAIDVLLSKLCKGAVKRLDAEVRVATRIGLYELHCMRTPSHAAVDQAVQLIRVLRRPRAAGFVNAVLRAGVDCYLPDDPVLDHPRWLTRRWGNRYGERVMQDWCARMATPAPLALCLKPGTEAPQESEPATCSGEPVADCYWVQAKGRVELLPGYEQGAWWVMDPAAAATADLLQVQAGERVLDACAAPGGKTLRMLCQGADITATDRNNKRLRILSENLERTGLSAESQVVDWSKPHPELERFDAALVDAPCTGLGTTRRHPEIRWSRGSTSPREHSGLQGLILENVAASIKPSGRVVYAVCSPEPEEGEQVVQEFLDAHPEWRLDSLLETAPPQAHEDAFYAARLVRAET